MTKTAETPGQDIAVEANKSTFDDAQLATMVTMSEALAALGAVTTAEDWADYGTGFDLLDNKDRLVGVPFVIVEWRFTKSQQYAQTFVSAMIVDEKDNRFILNDGSTGICAQLRSVTDRRIARGDAFPQAGLIVRKGLRRSNYKVAGTDKDTGEEVMLEASTFYLA